MKGREEGGGGEVVEPEYSEKASENATYQSPKIKPQPRHVLTIRTRVAPIRAMCECVCACVCVCVCVSVSVSVCVC